MMLKAAPQCDYLQAQLECTECSSHDTCGCTRSWPFNQ